MCSAPNVYMFVYILTGTHMVPLRKREQSIDVLNVTKIHLHFLTT